MLLMGCESVEINKYDGDGIIITSGRNIASQGYIVEFDTFDMSKYFYRRYRLSNLPDIGKTCIVGIRVNSGHNFSKKDLEAVLSIKLLDSTEMEVFNSSYPLKKWRFAKHKDANNKDVNFIYFMQQDRKTSFRLNELASPNELFLYIDYNPKNMQEGVLGTVQLSSGGFK